MLYLVSINWFVMCSYYVTDRRERNEKSKLFALEEGSQLTERNDDHATDETLKFSLRAPCQLFTWYPLDCFFIQLLSAWHTTHILITSAKEVMFSSAFDRQQHYRKTTEPIFTKIGGRVEHGPRKKPLDYGGNVDHVTLGLGSGKG